MKKKRIYVGIYDNDSISEVIFQESLPPASCNTIMEITDVKIIDGNLNIIGYPFQTEYLQMENILSEYCKDNNINEEEFRKMNKKKISSFTSFSLKKFWFIKEDSASGFVYVKKLDTATHKIYSNFRIQDRTSTKIMSDGKRFA